MISRVPTRSPSAASTSTTTTSLLLDMTHSSPQALSRSTAMSSHPAGGGARGGLVPAVICPHCGAVGLSSQAHRCIDADFIERLRSSGNELHIWTVDFLADARHYQALGVDSLMSNRPGFLRQELLTAAL